jgi:amino acid transporter, AAT family
VNKDKNINYQEPGEFRRALKARHIQLISLGGIIGSGYFLGTGAMISQIGPSICLAYILTGLIILVTMQCLGELAVTMPIGGSFINYTADFISPTLACGVGWAYWISWVVYIPAECLAGGIIMQYFTSVNGYVWAVLFGVIITYINLSKVGTFGEIEFWLSLIKILCLIVFSIVALLIFFNIIPNGQQHALGSNFILNHGGFFPKGWLPFFSGMVLLLVNYQGSEIIGLTAGESVDPGRMIPQAIKSVTFRILFIYIFPIFCLILIFPWEQGSTLNSVFSDALKLYHLNTAAASVSFVTLAAALSSSNSGIYGTIRSLSALSRIGMAPKVLAKLNNNAVPQNAGIVTLLAIWILLMVSFFFGQSKLYIALLLLSGFTGTFAWIALCWAQISFRKLIIKRGYSIKDLKYATPASPYIPILAIITMFVFLLFLAFNSEPEYKIAFFIGSFCLVIPMIFYALKTKVMNKKPTNWDSHSLDYFNRIYPPK